MFASFLWTGLLVTVCRADGSDVEQRLKPFAPSVLESITSEADRRRHEGDEPHTLDEGVMHMASQAGFRYKTCIKNAPFGGFSKFMLQAWAPAILGNLMNFKIEEDRRRWGFNKNNFITNIAEPLEDTECHSVAQLCTIKAMRTFINGLDDNQATVMTNYFPFVTSSNIEYFVGCAYEEIPVICSEYKELVCPESEH